MGSPYTHIQELLSFLGLDLKASDLARRRGFESDGSQNAMPSPQGGVKTRYGSKLLNDVTGMTGLVKFETTSMTGVSKTEIIGFGKGTLNNSTYPWRLIKEPFTVTNSHATLAATVSHYYDEATSQFRYKIVRGGVTLIDQAVGIGTEGSPYLLSTLDTAVDLLTSFSMTTTSPASAIQVAYCDIAEDVTVAANGGTYTAYFYYWEQVPSTATTSGVYATLKNAMLEIGSESYRNVSTAVVRNVLYMSPGVTSAAAVAGGSPITTALMTKYDGQDFYNAGFSDYLQKTFYISPTSTVATGTSQSDSKGTRTVNNALTGVYRYRCTVVRIDKAGNRIESNLSKDTGTLTPSGAVVVATTSNITGFTNDFAGYCHRVAKVNGVMTTTLTLTVDSGHTMTVGSIAYFYDTVQSRFIQREVTSVTSTTVVISTTSLDNNSNSINYDSGGTVSTYDNAFITNNFRLVIWRSEAGGGAFFLTEERPLVITGASIQTEYDDTADDDLGAEYVEPDYPHDEPPQGRYLCAFNDQLIVTGNDKRANTVYFSDDNPEYFPKGTHEFDLPEKASGIRQTGEVLACGTRNTLSVVSGDLLNFAFRVSKVGNNIGVTSHFSMQEAMEGVLMFSSYKGPYFLVGGRDLQPLGAYTDPTTGYKTSRLEPYWTALYSNTASKPVFERAIAAVLPNDNLYVLFVPTEDPARPCAATSDSVAFAYDYAKDRWDKWTGLNMTAGMVVLDDQLLFTSRVYAGGITYAGVITRLYQQQKRRGKYNYADHNTAITFRQRSHWETLGKPGLLKRFLRLKIFSHETREATTTALTLKTYVDFDETKISTTDTLSFSSTTQKSLTPKLKSETCKALQVVLESSSYYQPVTISGYELEAVANFRPVFKE